MTPGELLSQALARWPRLGAESSFLARLANVEAGPDFAPADYYLACAALKKNAEAVAAVTSLLDEQLAALRHLRLGPSERDDVRGALLAELFVAPDGKHARLERYSGTGPLVGWLRVVATRQALDLLRRGAREPVADDDTLLGELEAPSESPEVQHLKHRYSGELSAGFRRAIRALEPRQRNLLRQHYLDDLTLDELGALYRVHRATAARWLADARAALLERTRGELSQALGLPRLEVDSVMRLVQSRLDLSMGVFLSAGSVAPPRTAP